MSGHNVQDSIISLPGLHQLKIVKFSISFTSILANGIQTLSKITFRFVFVIKLAKSSQRIN